MTVGILDVEYDMIIHIRLERRLIVKVEECMVSRNILPFLSFETSTSCFISTNLRKSNQNSNVVE